MVLWLQFSMRPMPSVLALAASAMAGLAGVIASLDGDADIVPFFIGLTFLGGAMAWAAHPPLAARRRTLTRGIASLWVFVAAWAGVLLIWYLAMGRDGPPPPPEATYLGLTATVYHVIGLFGGAVLAAVSAFAPDTWLDRSRSPSSHVSQGTSAITRSQEDPT